MTEGWGYCRVHLIHFNIPGECERCIEDRERAWTPPKPEPGDLQYIEPRTPSVEFAGTILGSMIMLALGFCGGLMFYAVSICP